MLGRMAAAIAALALLASCASGSPDGGAAAERAPPPPNYAAPAAGADVAAPGIVAPGVSAPPAPAPEREASGDDDIVVPGAVERQVPPPAGDPRTVSERMADIRAWDRCVMQAQGAAEGDPLRPQLEVPEQACAQQLGMASRLAVPDNRRR